MVTDQYFFIQWIDTNIEKYYDCVNIWVETVWVNERVSKANE